MCKRRDLRDLGTGSSDREPTQLLLKDLRAELREKKIFAEIRAGGVNGVAGGVDKKG